MSESDPAKRAERDQEVRRLAYDEGLTLVEVAERVGTITDTRVGQILELPQGKKAVLDYLAHLPPGYGGVNARDVSASLRMDINKVQYLVDGLIKRGLVTADKGTGNGQGDHSAFYNIRLKKHPPKQFKLDLNGLAPTVDVLAKPTGLPLPATAPPVEVVVSLPAIPAVEPEEATIDVDEIPHYPLLNRLLTRNTKIAEAAKLLEVVGLDDLALQALQAQDTFTQLEMEYMRFARTHHGHD